MKKLVIIFGFIIYLSLINQILAQERIYFPFFEVINSENSTELQYATSKLLKTYIEENHDYLIILPKKGDGSYPREDFLESIENAKTYGAKYVLSGEINCIGNVAVITLSLFEVSTGNRVWHDLLKGIPLDDYDPALSRIGRVFNTSVSARNDGNIDDVTDYEGEATKLVKLKANHFTSILLGGNYYFREVMASRIGLGYSIDIYNVILGLNAEYSSNTFFALFRMEDDDFSDLLKIRSATFGMAILVPLSKQKNTFYVSGQLDIGLIQLDKDGTPPANLDAIDEFASGLHVNTGGGYILARNSMVNIRFEATASFPTYEVNNKYYPSIKFALITSIYSRKQNKD